MKALSYTFLAALMVTQISCKATKALDSAIDMNQKMDEMLKKMDETNKKMNGMEKVTDNGMTGMSQQMGEMLDAMKKMLKLGDKAEDLELAIAFKETIKESFSSPADPMPAAQKLVAVASVEQLLDITYIVTKTIQGTQVMEGDKVVSKELTTAEKISYSYGLNAIGYNLPPEKLNELVTNHIRGNSERVHMAYSLLAYRAQILDAMSSEKHVANASDEFHMRKPTNLPLLELFTREVIGFIEILEMESPEKISHNFVPQYSYSLDPSKASGFMEYLKIAIEKVLDCKNLESADGKQRLDEITSELTPYFEKYQVEQPNKQCS